MQEVKSPRHYPHDGERPAVQAQLAPDRRGIATVKLLAQRVAENYLVLPADLPFLRGECSPTRRRYPDQLEEGGCHGHARKLLWHAVDLQRPVHVTKHRLFFQRCHRTEAIIVVGRAAASLIIDAGLRILVGHQHDPVRVGYR